MSERRYAGVTHIDVAELDAEAVQATLDAHGISLSGLGYYPNPLAPDAAESQAAVDHLRRIIDAAPLLGVDRVNTFVGRDWKRSVDDNWSRFLEVWPPIVAHAEDAGVRIGIENCPMLFSADEWPGGKNLATTPATWRRMFESIPSRAFGLNYDPSHLVWLQIDPVAPIREFAHRLSHVHAKDVRIDRARLNDVGIMALPDEYHAPKLPGLGEVDWGAFFATLGDVGYRGPVCVEVEDRVYEESLATRVAALRQSLRFLRNFVAEPDSAA